MQLLGIHFDILQSLRMLLPLFFSSAPRIILDTWSFHFFKHLPFYDYIVEVSACRTDSKKRGVEKICFSLQGWYNRIDIKEVVSWRNLI